MKKLPGRIENAQFAAINIPNSDDIEYGFYVKFDFGRNGACDYNNRRNPIVHGPREDLIDGCYADLGYGEDYAHRNHVIWYVMAEFLRAAGVPTLEDLKNVFLVGLFDDSGKLVSVQFGLDEDMKEVVL